MLKDDDLRPRSALEIKHELLEKYRNACHDFERDTDTINEKLLMNAAKAWREFCLSKDAQKAKWQERMLELVDAISGDRDHDGYLRDEIRAIITGSYLNI